MITASRIREEVESYDLNNPHNAQFKSCILGEKFTDQYSLVFDEITKELESNPQKFYDRARSFVRNHKEIAFALRKMHLGTAKIHEDPAVAVLPAQQRVAKFYEAAPALRFYAFYLTGKKTPYTKLKESRTVLKCFKPFGLTSDDVDIIRKLRNAEYHAGYSSDGYVTSDTGEQICTHEKVLSLVDKIDEINRWVTMMTIYLLIHNPRFTLITLSLLTYEYRHNLKLYADSLGGIYKLLGTSRKESTLEKKEPKPPKLAQWITLYYPMIRSPRRALMGYALVGAIKQKISVAFKKTNDRSDIVDLFETIQEKSLEVAQTLRSMAVNQNDKEAIGALTQFAESIERDAQRKMDLARQSDIDIVDLMVDQLNNLETNP